MSVSSQSSRGGGLNRAPSPSGLYDVLDLILDKGLVIDLYVRVSLVGIELLTIDARIVIASVDTYLRFAEATNRLDLTQTGDAKGLPEFFGDMEEDGASRKTKGALQGAKDSVSDLFSSSDDDEEDEDDAKEEKKTRTPARRRRTSSSSSSSSSRRRSSSSDDDDE
jgi:gas vesicle structural protein